MTNFVEKYNIPNKVTIARVVMIFIFLVLCNVDEYIKAPAVQMLWRAIGLGFAILAGFTDILDGWLARKYNVVTDFGKLMDPLADKIFIATTFIMLVDKGILSGWVAVVVLTREFMVTGLRLLATNKGEVIAADVSGKAKTLLQMIFLILGGSIWVGWVEKAQIRIFWIICVWVIVAVTIYSGLSYFIRHRKLWWSST